MKLIAKSFERYNGGVRAKRQYGSSTITRFYVFRPEDAHDPSKWAIVETGGRTPGERATAAKTKGEEMLRAKGLTGAFSQIDPRRKRALGLGLAASAILIGVGITYAGTRPGGFIRKMSLPVVPGIDPSFVALADKWGAYYGVPLQWVLATILAESGGNPNAVGDYHVAANGASIGLMQVNSVAHAAELAAQGLTRESLFDPDINIQWGVKIFAQCMKRVQNALGGGGGDVGLLTRLCYTGVNTPSTIASGGDPLACSSCATTSKNWSDRLAQTSAAA